MNIKITLGLGILILGFFIGILVTKHLIAPRFFIDKTEQTNGNKETGIKSLTDYQSETIGFLPYWLLSSSKGNYREYLTTLAYFSLTIDKDGSIKKFTKPGESEPGYLTLTQGKMDKILNKAREDNLKLSLVVFMSDPDDITALMETPLESADKLVKEVTPLMDKYQFKDLNLDIEQVKEVSQEERLKFSEFVKEVRSQYSARKDLSLSIDVTASSFIKTGNLVDPFKIAGDVDKVIIMAYDYHHIGSGVSGPVSPGLGAGRISEYDCDTAVKSALSQLSPEKIILGIPLYGYEWETIRDVPRSAIIPGTGATISNRRAEELAKNCNNCKITFDETDKENYLIFKESSGNYYQAFFPDAKSTQYKVDLAKQYSIGGLALWALGYEGDTILEPLSFLRY